MTIFDTFDNNSDQKQAVCPVCGEVLLEKTVKNGRNSGRKYLCCQIKDHYEKSFSWADTSFSRTDTHAKDSSPVAVATAKIMSWTPQQQAYFDATSGSSDSIVLRANAGTGKTTTNTENTARIREANPAARIANVSFGRDIAKVIKEKLAQRGLYDIDASTIHSMCYKAVLNDSRLNKPKVEDRKASFILRDLTDTMPQDMAQNIQDVGGDILHLVALCKCTMSDPTIENLTALATKFSINFNDVEPEAINVAKRVFDISTEDFSTIDFNDMVWLVASGLVTTVPYDFIIVDEEQDLNNMQQKALIKFSHENTRFMGAGDPDQAIFAWSGADIDAYFNFINMINAKVLPLSVTFRCPKSHVEMSRQFLSEEGAKLFQAADSAPDGVIDTIDESKLLENVKPGDFVICRNNAPLILPAFELIRNGVKANILGRDIGKGLVSLVERFEHKKSITDIPALCNALDDYSYKECNKLIKCMRTMQAMTLRDQVDTIFAVSENCNTIDEMKVRISSIFADEALGVILSSVHRIKGKEAKDVFILRPDLFFPEWGNKEEEKHVAYVAHTRSMERIVFVNGK
jgi:hypothetical protein